MMNGEILLNDNTINKLSKGLAHAIMSKLNRIKRVTLSIDKFHVFGQEKFMWHEPKNDINTLTEIIVKAIQYNVLGFSPEVIVENLNDDKVVLRRIVFGENDRWALDYIPKH